MKKIDVLTAHMKNNEWKEALRMAARFPRLGSHKKDIQRGYEALVHPEFYSQLGRDIDGTIAAGITALKDRYTSTI